MHPDKYKEAVLKAKEVMEGIELDEELKKIAFSEIIKDVLSDNQYDTFKKIDKSLQINEIEVDGYKIGVISKHLNIVRDSINAVFSFEGDKISLEMPSDRLTKGKRKGTQEIALLICAVYTALGRKEIGTDLVREQCIQYDRYNSPNFMATLNRMNSFMIVKGTRNSKKKTLILKQTGREEAARIVKRLVGKDAA